MKRLLLATALVMVATPAYASGAKVKIDKRCVESMQKNLGATLKDAKLWCNPKFKDNCDKAKCE